MKDHTAIAVAVFLCAGLCIALPLYLGNLDNKRWAQFTKKHGVRLRGRRR